MNWTVVIWWHIPLGQSYTDNTNDVLISENHRPNYIGTSNFLYTQGKRAQILYTKERRKKNIDVILWTQMRLFFAPFVSKFRSADSSRKHTVRILDGMNSTLAIHRSFALINLSRAKSVQFVLITVVNRSFSFLLE